MANEPTAQQVSAIYTLTSPRGNRVVFNDPADADFVGKLVGGEGVTGLDSPEVRQTIHELVEADGAISSRVFHGSRPLTLRGVITAGAIAERNEKETKLNQVVNECRASDGDLEWTPDGGVSHFIRVRKNQPTRIRGGWVKEFMAALIAADPRIYGTTLNTISQVAAQTAFLRPDGNVTQEWDITNGGSTTFQVLDEPVVQPTAPVTASDFIRTAVQNDVAEVTLATQVVQSVTGGTLWAYVDHEASADAAHNWNVLLRENDGTPSTLATIPVPEGTTPQWMSAAFGVITQAQLDALSIQFAAGAVTAAHDHSAYAAYVELDYIGAPTVEVVNDGSGDSPPALIRVTGPITDPTITRVAGSDTAVLKFVGLTLASSSNFIDIDVLNKTAVDDAGVSVFSFVDFPTNADWFELFPGSNTVTLTGTGLTADTALRVDWRSVWL